MLEGYTHLITGSDGDWQAEADLSAADQALHECLGACIIYRDKLAAAAVTPRGFPAQAIDVVMAGLAAKRADLFGPGREDSLPYRYAADVVRAGITAAVENIDYYRVLEPRLQLEMAQALGQVRETVGQVADRTEAIKADTSEILRLLGDLVGGQEGLDDLLRRKEAELEATRAELLGLLQGILEESIPRDRIDGALSQANERLKENRVELERLRGLANEVPDIEPDLAEARAALDQAGMMDLGRAQSALRRARRRYRDAVKAERDRQAVNLARLAEAEADLAMARSRYLEAAELFSEAANELPKKHAARIGELRDRQGQGLSKYGETFPGLDALHASVAAYEAALEVYTRKAMPAAWAGTQNNLANALQVIGERTGGDAGVRSLQRAVAGYEAALEVRTREAMPYEWAATQNNLANALRVVGERTGGDAGVRLLQRAVAAYEAAHEVYTREAMPAYWAGTQNNLANALQVVGERMGGEVGVRLLQRAVAAYEAALEVYTREATPADWAMTQNNLAVALQVVGECTDGKVGVRLLQRAVAASEAALEVYAREAMPAAWAGTQNNLANALKVVGERTGGDAGVRLLQRAVAAYEAAHEVYTRADMPAAWATTQNNMANALRVVGERTGGDAGVRLLQRAVAAYESALEVYTRADMPAYWSYSKTGLGCAWIGLGIATADRMLVQAGIEAIDEAIEMLRSSASDADVDRVEACRRRGSNFLKP
ncbi:MAG: hypothetical protein RIC87_01630 [Kiloniellales bacterium]